MKGKINKERQASGARWAAGGLGDPRGCGLPWVLTWGKVSKGVILPPSLGDAGENLFAGADRWTRADFWPRGVNPNPAAQFPGWIRKSLPPLTYLKAAPSSRLGRAEGLRSRGVMSVVGCRRLPR